MPRARRSDPVTSHAAAQSVRNLTESQFAVLRVFERLGALTDERLHEAYAAEMPWVPRQSPSGLRTRRAELVDLGYLTDSGQRRKLSTGRHGIVWTLNEPGAPGAEPPAPGSLSGSAPSHSGHLPTSDPTEPLTQLVLDVPVTTREREAA